MPGRHGVSRSQPRRGPKDAFPQGPGLPGLRKGRGRELAHLSDADMRVLSAFESLALGPLARVGRRPSRLHAANDQHARKTLERASPRDRVWPSLPGALQVFPGGERGLFLPGRPLRRAKCTARELGCAGGGVAVVKPAAGGARGSGVSNSFRVAAATPQQLAGNREPPAVRGRVERFASMCPTWLSLWKCRMDGRDREAIENRVNITPSWKTEEGKLTLSENATLLSLCMCPRFGGRHLFCSVTFSVPFSVP